MERAKDLIADEQWARAVDELKAAAADPKETNKDEALFWLAHSQNQSRDFAGAVETIRRLERTFPASRWVKPARSLRIEIAQRLQRNDVLWWHTLPPAPPAAPTPPVATVEATPTVPPPMPSTRRRRGPPKLPGCRRRPEAPGHAVRAAARPADAAIAAGARRAARGTARQPPGALPAAPPPPPPAGDVGARRLPAGYRSAHPGPRQPHSHRRREGHPDAEGDRAQRRQAEPRHDARCSCSCSRAVPKRARPSWTSPRPVPRSCALRRSASSDASAARRVSNDLLQVYATGTVRVKYQVVTSLGSRDDAVALLQIAQSETDRELRDVTIVTLGQAGARRTALRFLQPGAIRRQAPDHQGAVLRPGRRLADSHCRARARRGDAPGSADAAAPARHAEGDGVRREGGAEVVSGPACPP